MPPAQVLPSLQRSPVSEHAEPFLLVLGPVTLQLPELGSQETVLHSAAGSKLQSFGVPVHVPAMQTAPVLQRSVEAHEVPSCAASGAETHALVDSEHATLLHSGGIMPQSFGGPPTHTPPMQVSFVVQNLPSSQVAPS